MPDPDGPTQTPIAPANAPARPRRRGALRRHLGDYAFLVPNALGFLAFTLVPILAAFVISFCIWDPVEGWAGLRWAGLWNYSHILGAYRTDEGLQAADARFWAYAYNTAYLMIGIPIGMTLSLVTALLLNQKLRGVVFFRTIFFIPTICSSVAVAVLWRWIYQADTGLLNQLLGVAGVANPPNWLMDDHWAKPALIILGLWTGIGGYNCILYLAGLQNVPRELYEAAEMDGAGWWGKLRHITWPQLAPTTFFILVMSIIGGLQGHFTAIKILTGGRAGTTTLLYYIYQNAFESQDMGYACALAVILFLIILAFTLVQWRYGKEARQEW
jgi:multiple sugar transport system permease protein